MLGKIGNLFVKCKSNTLVPSVGGIGLLRY